MGRVPSNVPSMYIQKMSGATLPIVTWAVTHSGWYALMGLGLALIYLGAQQPVTDDHLAIKERWPSLWAFLTGPRRSR